MQLLNQQQQMRLKAVQSHEGPITRLLQLPLHFLVTHSGWHAACYLQMVVMAVCDAQPRKLHRLLTSMQNSIRENKMIFVAKG